MKRVYVDWVVKKEHLQQYRDYLLYAAKSIIFFRRWFHPIHSKIVLFTMILLLWLLAISVSLHGFLGRSLNLFE
jgi:hypothetical protein